MVYNIMFTFLDCKKIAYCFFGFFLTKSLGNCDLNQIIIGQISSDHFVWFFFFLHVVIIVICTVRYFQVYPIYPINN